MQHEAEPRVMAWIRRMSREGGGRIALAHVTAHGAGQSLGEWPVSARDADDVHRQLGREIVDVALDDACGQESGTPQQYVVAFFPEEEPTKAFSRLPFRLAPVARNDFGDIGSTLASEPPTAAGLLKQQMRQNEVFLRTIVASTDTTASMLTRMVERLELQNASQQARLLETLTTLEDLISQKHEREQRERASEADRQHRRELTSKVVSLVPLLLTRGAAAPLALAAGASSSVASPAAAAAVRMPPPSPPVVASAPAAREPLASPPSGEAAPSTAAANAPSPVPGPAALQGELLRFFTSLEGEQLEKIRAVLTEEQTIALTRVAVAAAGVEP